jgi:hypothetical protein
VTSFFQKRFGAIMKLINGRHVLLLVIASSFVVAMVACDPGTTTENTTGGESSSSGSGSGSGSGSSSSGGPQLKLTPIDDMEDGNGSILSSAGAWYTYNDMTVGATQAPIVGDPFMMTAVPKANGPSKMAANTTGNGFTTWGAGFGFDLNNDGVAKKAFDASQYSGITFWALAGAGATTSIRFNVGDSQTTPEAGKCGMMCSDDFGANVTLTGDWQQFTFRFADMKAVNWSKANLPAIDKAGLYYVHFQASQSTIFDIWIDDISFFTE